MEDNGIVNYVYVVEESALTTFLKTRKAIMEECNVAYLVSVKYEESNHYNCNCLLYQRCWLL